MGTITKFLNSYIKIHSHSKDPDKIKRKLKKFSICVVRSIISENKIHCVSSAPCMDCINKLKTVGLKNIIYSNQDGTITNIKLSSFHPSNSFVTSSMKKKYLLKICALNP